MTRILFLGASFINKGSAAMLISASRALKAAIPRASFVVASGLPEHDLSECARLGLSYVDIAQGTHTGARFRRLIWRAASALLHRLGLDVGEKMEPKSRAIAAADVVVDVSGISFSGDLGACRGLGLALTVLTAKLLGKPFVLYSQAMGPFESHLDRLVARLVLPRVDLVIARGQITAEYLRCVGVSNVHVCPDSAFLLEPAPKARVAAIMAAEGVSVETKPLVGLVPNARIYARCQMTSAGTSESNRYVLVLAELLEHLVHALHVTVVCLLHSVAGPDDEYDDQDVARAVLRRVCCPNRVIVVPARYTPGEMKGLIATLDMLVGARFHSLVAAIGTGVPCVAMGWSHKYVELMNMAGLGDYTIDYKEMTAESAIQVVDQLWNCRGMVRASLLDMVPELSRSAARSAELVRDLVASRYGGNLA